MAEKNPLSQFVLSNSHDLKSTIATIQSFLNILEMRKYEIDPEELKEFSEHLQIQLKEYILKMDRLIALASQNL